MDELGLFLAWEKCNQLALDSFDAWSDVFQDSAGGCAEAQYAFSLVGRVLLPEKPPKLCQSAHDICGTGFVEWCQIAGTGLIDAWPSSDSGEDSVLRTGELTVKFVGPVFGMDLLGAPDEVADGRPRFDCRCGRGGLLQSRINHHISHNPTQALATFITADPFDESTWAVDFCLV
jgi:hypothetical protein